MNGVDKYIWASNYFVSEVYETLREQLQYDAAWNGEKTRNRRGEKVGDESICKRAREKSIDELYFDSSPAQGLMS